MPVVELSRPCVGKRILWLDDEYSSFPSVQYEMESTGATVDAVVSLAEARQHLKEHRYDLLVVDALVLRGGAEIGTSRYEGLALLDPALEGPQKIILLSVLSEQSLRLGQKHSVRAYFHKVKLGPRLAEFHSCVERLLQEPAND